MDELNSAAPEHLWEYRYGWPSSNPSCAPCAVNFCLLSDLCFFKKHKYIKVNQCMIERSIGLLIFILPFPVLVISMNSYIFLLIQWGVGNARR